MANQSQFPAPTSFVKGLQDLYLKITYGAGGAATISGEGFGTFTDTTTGESKITLDETWPGGIVGVSFAVNAVGNVSKFVLENDSTTSTSDPHIDINAYHTDGASGKADPADGTVVYVKLTMAKYA